MTARAGRAPRKKTPEPIFRLSALIIRGRCLARSHHLHSKGDHDTGKHVAELAHAVHLCIYEGLL